MTINASNITPSQAINRILMMVRGNMVIRKEAEKTGAKVPPLLSVYLEGEPGVGKSAVPNAMGKILNYYVEDIRANQMSPDDAGGQRMPDPENHETIWYPPAWMPRPDGKVVKDGVEYDGTILFFDELASADDRVRKPLFGTFLDRKMNGRPLPENCIVMAGGNEAETGTMVFELDNATRSRFITHRIVANFESWLRDYAADADIAPTTVAFLKSNVDRFCETESALDQDRQLYGNPRSWEHVSVAERSIMLTKADREDKEHRAALQDAIAGKVGIELALEYMSTFDIITKMSTLYDILQMLKDGKEKQIKQMWPKELSQVYALTYSMMAHPKDLEGALEIYALMDLFPKEDETKLPFNEMKPAIMEVITKSLRKRGVPDKDMKKLSKQNSEMVDDVITGPLIKVDFDA